MKFLLNYASYVDVLFLFEESKLNVLYTFMSSLFFQFS